MLRAMSASRRDAAVHRAAPCPLGLDTVADPVDQELPDSERSVGARWPGKVGGDLLRRAEVGPPLAMAGVGFPTGRGGASAASPVRKG